MCLVKYSVSSGVFIAISACVMMMFRDQELKLRKMSFINADINIEKNLTLVLDELPDCVIIADPKRLIYMNIEAWKLLKCQSPEANGDHRSLDGVFCLDIGNCAVLTPLEQLINFLTGVDKRLKLISKDTFLEAMINIATSESMLLHMHQGL